MKLLQKFSINHYLLVFNALGFQMLWFLLVLYGNHVVYLAIAYLLIHLILQNQWQKEFVVIVAVSTIGTFIDSVLTHLGVFSFNQSASALFIPMWLIMLWAIFASTINHSLQFLTKRIGLAMVFAALFAPLSYFAGYKLGAVMFEYSVVYTLLIISMVWLILLPSILCIVRMINLVFANQPENESMEYR